jgi:hypothetical protein
VKVVLLSIVVSDLKLEMLFRVERRQATGLRISRRKAMTKFVMTSRRLIHSLKIAWRRFGDKTIGYYMPNIWI